MHRPLTHVRGSYCDSALSLVGKGPDLVKLFGADRLNRDGHCDAEPSRCCVIWRAGAVRLRVLR
jgi:hypothetical protein